MKSGPDVLRYCRRPAALTFGNTVRLLRDGKETFPAMLAAIAEASRTVHLETYILRGDATGRRFAEALAAAVRRGARVRLVYDAIGSFTIDRAYVDGLKQAGVAVHPYRPIRLPASFREGHRRDHRKILVVDGRVGFAGGLNIADEYNSPEEGGGGWRDNHLRVEGPAAAALDAEFLRLWKEETERPTSPPPCPAPSEGRALVEVLANRRLRFRYRIRSSYLCAIAHADRSIDIVNAYFIPDRWIRRALRRAARRGVAVRILLPGLSDVPLVSYASRHLYGSFLRAGVRIFEYTQGISHCRTTVVDRLWTAVGSYNLDPRSLLHNLELDLHVLDQGLGNQASESFERDLRDAREITLADWERRPWLQRLRDRAAFAVRYWL